MGRERHAKPSYPFPLLTPATQASCLLNLALDFRRNTSSFSEFMGYVDVTDFRALKLELLQSRILQGLKVG